MRIPFILYGVKGIFLYNSDFGNTLYIKPQTGKGHAREIIPQIYFPVSSSFFK